MRTLRDVDNGLEQRPARCYKVLAIYLVLGQNGKLNLAFWGRFCCFNGDCFTADISVESLNFDFAARQSRTEW